MTEPIETAFDAAVDLIRVYVLRGDTISSLRSGAMGSYSEEYEAQIGGYLWTGPLAHKKRFGPDKVLVHRIGRRDCGQVVSLRQAYEFVKKGEVRQLALL